MRVLIPFDTWQHIPHEPGDLIAWVQEHRANAPDDLTFRGVNVTPDHVTIVVQSRSFHPDPCV